MALVAGLNAPFGRIMGHAGAVVRDEQQEAATRKLRRLEEAGVVLTDHPEKFGSTMKQLLSKNYSVSHTSRQSKTPLNSQQREIHSSVRSSGLLRGVGKLQAQRRHFRVLSSAIKLDSDINEPDLIGSHFQIHFGVDRSAYKPMVLVQQMVSGTAPLQMKLGFAYHISSTDFEKAFMAGLQTSRNKPAREEKSGREIFEDDSATKKFAAKAYNFVRVFKDKDASSLKVNAAYNLASQDWVFKLADAELDDSAYKSSQRQKELYEHRDMSLEIPTAIEAEKYGIVYVRLPGEGNIGTLGKQRPGISNSSS